MHGCTIVDVMKQATKFTEAQKVWTSRVGRSLASAPKLTSLPPTTESFQENVARAHLQTAIWKSSLHHNYMAGAEMLYPNPSQMLMCLRMSLLPYRSY